MTCMIILCCVTLILLQLLHINIIIIIAIDRHLILMQQTPSDSQQTHADSGMHGDLAYMHVIL